MISDPPPWRRGQRSISVDKGQNWFGPLCCVPFGLLLLVRPGCFLLWRLLVSGLLLATLNNTAWRSVENLAKITHCSDFQTSAEERTGRAQAGDQVGDVQGVGLGAKMCSVLCILGGGGEAGRRAASLRFCCLPRALQGASEQREWEPGSSAFPDHQGRVGGPASAGRGTKVNKQHSLLGGFYHSPSTHRPSQTWSERGRHHAGFTKNTFLISKMNPPSWKLCS